MPTIIGAREQADIEGVPVLSQLLPDVAKRDGRIVKFSTGRIVAAIRGASNDTPDEDMSKNDMYRIASRIAVDSYCISAPRTIGVEEIQDAIEAALIENGYHKTAKNFIIYRSEHAKFREARSRLMDIYNRITFSSARDEDIKRENANIDGNTAMGTMLKYGSEGAKHFVDDYVLPKNMARAHIDGDIHIHDKDFYMLTETCCQIDLLKLFKGGFGTGHGAVREPNSIETAAALACIALQANQNEMHGGQSIPAFDFFMAPYVLKTYRQEFVRVFCELWSIASDIDTDADNDTESGTGIAEDVRGTLENATSIDDASPVDALAGGVARRRRVALKARKLALANTERRTHQAMEALIHNLNTMHSRAGAQVPFTSLNYGTDTSPEGRMVIRNLLKATQEGLGDGETPIFPVQIFKVKEGVNYHEEDPNHDLLMLAIETSAKRLFPNFSFLDAPFNRQYYKDGDYNSEVAYMGCRTRVMGNTYDSGSEVTCGRGNLSFTTINLPRIGIMAKDRDDLFRLLDEKIDLCFDQLLHRFGIQSQKTVRNYPFLMGNGIWLGSDELGLDDTVGDVLRHGTLSVGFIGLAEMLVAFMGRHHGDSWDAQQLGLEVVSHMRDRCDEESLRHKLNFSLLATPAEGLSGRFVKLDRKRFGEIPGVTDRDYYTNSFHVPVYHQIAIHRKIELEAPYHAFTNAGHITYVEVDGDIARNIGAFKSIIKHMHDSGVGYGSVNHPLDRDPVCGYVGVINGRCPRCGRMEGEGVDEETLRAIRRRHP